MIEQVIKYNGSVEDFDAEKFNRWAKYACKMGGNWSEIALEAFRKLPKIAKSSDIHEAMINVCYSKESIEYSRIAARLEVASLRKNMQRVLDLYPNKDTFTNIRDTLVTTGVWCGNTVPEVSECIEELYKEIKDVKLESWQVAQWGDKYLMKFDGVAVETPHIAAMGIGLGIHGDTKLGHDLVRNIIYGKVNLPTPILNGVRNGDFDGVSCAVIESGDTVESIGVAEHLAMRLTAKKAGIGIRYNTRSKGASVKKGAVEHLGKQPIYNSLSSAVKTFTQVSRGGSATVAFDVIDPEVESIALWKSQRSDIENRIDKVDYSFAFNDAFLEAVVARKTWLLFDYAIAPEVYESFYKDSVERYNEVVEGSKHKAHREVDALELLKHLLVIRQETGRLYCLNVSRVNEHTPFFDNIKLSNLCQEVMLPTKPYKNMLDLYSDEANIVGQQLGLDSLSGGETAFCVLAALVPSNITDEEYYEVAKNTVATLNVLIEKCPKMTPNHNRTIKYRKSLGVGVTGLAGLLYKNGLDYDGSDKSLEFVHDTMERHYHALLTASQELYLEGDCSEDVQGVDLDWLPIDTKRSKWDNKLDWESLRGKPRLNSVLCSIQPTESSSLVSNAENAVYPPRDKVVNKKSRKGIVQFISEGFEEGVNLKAWDIDPVTLSRYYGVIQDFTDQGISADTYFDPDKFDGGKKPMSNLVKEWVAHFRLGNKSMYYVNTRDSSGGGLQSVMQKEYEEDACTTCTL